MYFKESVKNNDDKTKNKTCILEQYGKYPYHLYSNIVITGYIRDIQNKLLYDSIIPTDIDNICFNFYFEVENKYIQSAQKLYNIFEKQKNDLVIDGFDGQELTTAIKQNLTDYIDGDILSFCADLLKYKLIKLVDYPLVHTKKTFPLLSDHQYTTNNNNNNNINAVFHDDSNFEYNFVFDKLEYVKKKQKRMNSFISLSFNNNVNTIWFHHSLCNKYEI